MKRLLLICPLSFWLSLSGFSQTAADHYRWGNMKFDVGDYRAAIEYFNRSLEIDPYNAGVYFNRATANYNLLEYGAALADFTRVINLNPNDIKAYILRGFCKFHLGDQAGACADWEHAGSNQCYDACELIDEYCK
jgi:tetratricopeptide (TPR) repeat protein